MEAEVSCPLHFLTESCLQPGTAVQGVTGTQARFRWPQRRQDLRDRGVVVDVCLGELCEIVGGINPGRTEEWSGVALDTVLDREWRFVYSVKTILSHMSEPTELLMLVPPVYPLFAVFSVLLWVCTCKMMVHWPF